MTPEDKYAVNLRYLMKKNWKKHLESEVYTGLNTEQELKEVEEELKELEAQLEAIYNEQLNGFW